MKKNTKTNNENLIYQNEEMGIKVIKNGKDNSDLSFTVIYGDMKKDFISYREFVKDWNFKLLPRFYHQEIYQAMFNVEMG